MQEVFEELLGDLKDNPVIGHCLQGDLPWWDQILDEKTYKMLSSGEQVLVNIALAMYNGHRSAAFADIFRLDRPNQRRVLNALKLRLGELPA